MFQRVLVPLDGSSGAEHSIPTAAHIARTTKGSLVFLHVIPSLATQGSASEKSDPEAKEGALKEATTYLTETLTKHAEELTGVSVELEVGFGSVATAIASASRLESADLIVICRHREVGFGQWERESIARQVMHHSSVPVLVINEHEPGVLFPDASHPLRLLVALDGSLFAEKALEPALNMLAQFADTCTRELCLIRIVELIPGDRTGDDEPHTSIYTRRQAHQEAERYLKTQVEALQEKYKSEQNLHITYQVITSPDVATALLKGTAHTDDSEQTELYPLIALATHGREGHERAIMGSVAEELLDTTTHPLLIVCPSKRVTKSSHAVSSNRWRA